MLDIIKSDPALASKIEILCDFVLNDHLTELDKNYLYSDQLFRCFGRDASGGEYGFIGEGDIESLSIGYSSSEGEAGKVADNLKDFFHLIVFYPFWKDLCKFKSIDDDKKVHEYEASYIDDMSQLDVNYSVMQKEIASALKIENSGGILKRFYKAVSSEPKFKTFSAEDDNPSNDLY